MVKMVDTLTQPATAGLEHPRRRARVAEVLDQPRTPAGRIPGRPAALTPSSTAGRVKGATPCCLPRRAPRPRPGRASERVGGGGSGCFPGPPGSWPVTGGSLGDRRPRTGADRSGRRISPPSLPPATGRDGRGYGGPVRLDALRPRPGIRPVRSRGRPWCPQGGNRRRYREPDGLSSHANPSCRPRGRFDRLCRRRAGGRRTPDRRVQSGCIVA